MLGSLEEKNKKEIEQFWEDSDYKNIDLQKQIRQLKSDYENEKAILVQKLEISKAQIQEFEQREKNLLKMNYDIISTLNDLNNNKEDSSLRNKIFEELALAKQEKDLEKKQQEKKIESLKKNQEIIVAQLVERLEASEQEKKEIQEEYEKEKQRYMQNFEEFEHKIEILNKELFEEKKRVKGSQDFYLFEQTIAKLTEENAKLKQEHDIEIKKLREELDNNLTEFKQILEEEKSNFENRIRKAREMLIKCEEDNEAKAYMETQLFQEISELNAKILELQTISWKEREQLFIKKNEATEKLKELEKDFGDIYTLIQKEANNFNGLSALQEALKRFFEFDRFFQQVLKAQDARLQQDKGEEHLSTDITTSFFDFEPHTTSLVCSIVNEPLSGLEKKPVLHHQKLHQIDSTQSSWKEGGAKMISKKTHHKTKENIHSEAISLSEFDNQRIPIRIASLDNKDQDKIISQSLKNEDLHTSKEMNEILCPLQSVVESQRQHGNIEKLDWILKDINEVREPSFYSQKIQTGEASLDEKTFVKFNPSRNSERNVIGNRLVTCSNDDRSLLDISNQLIKQSNFKKHEGLRRSIFEDSLVEKGPGDQRKRESHNFSKINYLWKNLLSSKEETVFSGEKKSIFSQEIEDVMKGLSNIKNRLEKQQEDLMCSKDGSFREKEDKSRSYSIRCDHKNNNSSLMNKNESFYQKPQREKLSPKQYFGSFSYRRSRTRNEQPIEQVSSQNKSLFKDNCFYRQDKSEAKNYSQRREPIMLKDKIHMTRVYDYCKHRNSLS